jgi:3',5'-cyclic AMP phosphodiesterase CpdA
MLSCANFLHLTDTHLSLSGTPFSRDDHKVSIPEISHPTRETVLELLFGRLAERLDRDGKHLDGVLFTGDAQDRGKPGGHQILLDLLLKHFRSAGVKPENIVAIPGNHDIPRNTQPSSSARYAAFVQVWRAAGCVTPWLDGVDALPSDGGPHSLVDKNSRWAVFPINTSNWSHVAQTLPEPLASIWLALPKLGSNGDSAKEEALRRQLEDLARFDMARVSDGQLEAMRSIIDATARPAAGRQVRIALLHHHLRSPSMREELKPFADISNLEHLRSFFRDSGISIVLHGHKHERSAQFEHIYDNEGNKDHRIFVVSGSTFEPGRESEAARLVNISGLPHVPTISIEPLPVPRSGVEVSCTHLVSKAIWTSENVPGAPIVIQGSDIDEVYERVCVAAGSNAANGMLIAHLDLPASVSSTLPLPTTYPLPEPMGMDDRQHWLSELVAWWQLERSGLEYRMPFVHGTRLRRFGGKIDQIGRIVALLRVKASTRALAVLIDPFQDFAEDGAGEEFASFCLVQFKRRETSAGKYFVDVITFYRAQEFARWWPINIAELRYIQLEVCKELEFLPGRITTIAADARTHARSPTQVAMPIIDRWLDQAPERFHLLATALLRGEVRSQAQHAAVRGWMQSLSDLEATASAFNSDGIPIAIDGLKRLASYLEVAKDESSIELGEFVRILRRLTRVNEGFERSGRSKSEFDRWAPDALDAVSGLRELTQKRLGPV